MASNATAHVVVIWEEELRAANQCLRRLMDSMKKPEDQRNIEENAKLAGEAVSACIAAIYSDAILDGAAPVVVSQHRLKREEEEAEGETTQ